MRPRLLLQPLPAWLMALTAGCAMPERSVQLAAAPDDVRVKMRPTVIRAGEPADVVVQSPGADSIAVESANGIDRYWVTGPVLRAQLSRSFGDTVSGSRFAVRWQGKLLDVLEKPAKIAACRAGRCSEFYYEFPVKLPERNRRSVAVTAAYSTVFASRAVKGDDRSVLFKQVLNNSLWSVQTELATGTWSAQLQGFYGPSQAGGSLDLSREIQRLDSEVSYGVAMHLGLAHDDWLREVGSPFIGSRTVYQATIGPSIMIRGVTASSQLGIYADGNSTMQVMSTRISVNGNLTTVRSPVTATAEKTFSFGGGAIVSRRRDAVERLTAAIYLLDDLALKLGVSTHRSAWPGDVPSRDLRTSEMLFTLGGQYSLTW
jgi:hypothetical protein